MFKIKASIERNDILSNLDLISPVKIGDESYHFPKEVDPRLFEVKDYRFEISEFSGKKHTCLGDIYYPLPELREISKFPKVPPTIFSNPEKLSEKLISENIF